jgi:hypothetical protein
MNAREYTPEEIRFLKENIAGHTHAEITALFNERFGTDFKREQISMKLHKYGILKSHKYTPEEIRFLKENIAGCRYAEITALFNERFGLDISLRIMTSTLKRYGILNKMLTGKVPLPVGTERVLVTGYTEVKVCNPNTWKLKHHLIWEAANGDIPDRHYVIFADHNTLNLKLENLILVSDAELAYMNHFKLISVNGEITKTGKLIADTKMMLNMLRKKIPLDEVKKKITGIWEARE